MSRLFEYIDTLNSPYEAFTQTSEGFPVRPHWHYYMEIIIMIEGHICVESEKNTSILGPGDIFVFCPKMIHSMTSCNGEDFLYGVLKFDIGRISIQGSSTPSMRLLFESARLSENVSLHFKSEDLPGTRMLDLFNSCEEELAKRNYGYDMVLHSNICEFLIRLIRVMRERGFNTDSAILNIAHNTTVDTITEYIDAHSSEKLSINTLAELCNMSYSYFAKSFRQIYGRTCTDYIEFIRISKAEDLLLYTDFDLTYISLETGFSDCSHLIKTFKKWKGITPKQYRMRRKVTR